jgi:hypothetical protein
MRSYRAPYAGELTLLVLLPPAEVSTSFVCRNPASSLKLGPMPMVSYVYPAVSLLVWSWDVGGFVNTGGASSTGLKMFWRWVSVVAFCAALFEMRSVCETPRVSE